MGTVLDDAVREFAEWWDAKQKAADISNKIASPLYHYTDASGLMGIVRNQEMWATSLFHMNDPSELSHGIEMALDIVKRVPSRSDKAVDFFCKRLEEVMLRHFGEEFAFFVASFSRASDDLGQWRAYGDNGRGFALGIAPEMFHPVDKPDLKPHEKTFVFPVLYNDTAARQSFQEAIDHAVDLVARPACRSYCAGNSKAGREFFKELSIQLSVPLLWNSLTVKHPAYANEAEVRLILLGSKTALEPFTETRVRSGELVPFIKIHMPIRANDGITEIVIGPAADQLKATDALWNFLKPLKIDPANRVRSSTIPYRP